MMLRLLSTLVVCGICLLGAAGKAAEGQTTIRGSVYISPTGKAEGDLVMRGAGVEVFLLRGESGFEAELAALRQNRSPTIEKQLQAVNKAQQEFLRSSRVAKEEMERKSAVLRQERAKLAELRQAYQEEANNLIAKHTFAKTKADSEGKFSLTGVPPGRYLAYSHFEIVGMGIHYYWLVPVEVKREKEIDVSLDKLNATPLF